MANSNKCKCKECKRTISITDQFCPYCSSPNPYASELSKSSKPVKAVQKAPVVDDLEDFMSQEETNEQNEQEIESYTDDVEDFESFEDGDSESDLEDQYTDPFESDAFINEEQEEEEDEYENYKENYGGQNQRTSEQINQKKNENKLNSDKTGSINSRDGRAPINWTDEEQPLPVDYSNIYDENGVYNPNYDGFYNDTLPKIQNEIDSLIAGREKTILKIVFGFVAIFGIIVYLILTI